MYNLLIADDEKIIREGVGKIFSDHGEYRVFYASNGLEALQVVENNEIHAMLIDIVMPNVDGLELLKALSERNDESLKVILSGFDNFSYVQEALVNNVEEYLLKPCSPIILRELAEKLVVILQKREENKIEYNNLLETSKEYTNIIRDKLFEKMLNDKWDRDEYESKKEFIGIKPEADEFQALLISLTNKQKTDNSAEYRIQADILYVANTIKQLLKDFSGYFYIDNNNEPFTLLRCTVGREKTIGFEEIFDKISYDLQNSSIKIFGALGTIVDNIAKIKYSYKEALTALKFNSSFNKDGLVEIMNIQQKDEEFIYLLDEEELSSIIKIADKQKLLEYIRTLTNGIEKYKDKMSIERIELILIRGITTGLSMLAETTSDGYIIINNKYINPILGMQELQSLQEKYDWLEQFMVDIVDTINTYRVQNNERVFLQIKDFIEENYKDDQILQRIEDDIHKGKYYLSKLFKENIGLSIIEYQHRYRINKAKELLETSNMKIIDISEEIGYLDEHYFSTMFKRLIGISPSKYKKYL